MTKCCFENWTNCSKILRLFSDFDLQSFADSIYTEYMKNALQETALVYYFIPMMEATYTVWCSRQETFLQPSLRA